MNLHDARKEYWEGCILGSAWQILSTVMAHGTANININTTNPFYLDKAFLNKKLPCPHAFCSQNVSFYEESGIEHHWRVIHNNKCTTKDFQNARKLMMEVHGDETLRCLGELFIIRSTKV